MKRINLSRRLSLAVSVITLLVSVEAHARVVVDGYPIANFGVTANVGADGSLFGRILQNTGRLGGWLNDRGALTLSVCKDGRSALLSDFRDKEVNRRFPFVTARYADSPVIGSSLSLRVWAPVGVNDVSVTALPVIMIDAEVKNPTKSVEAFQLAWDADLQPGGAKVEAREDFCAVASGGRLLAASVPMEVQGSQAVIPLTVRPGKSLRLRMAVVLHDKEWVTVRDFGSAELVAGHVFANWGKLLKLTRGFDRALPSSGIEDIDEAMRWYIVPALSLTRCTADGNVLTMGYCELNQRDSYWTSWLHLALFPDLERRMIAESAAAQSPEGKIPTCILPVIERHDDIDINCFFIMRATRYARGRGDWSIVRDNWKALRNAADWLISRDVTGDGLPVQVSFWGDWKDVKGVEGRKYSPFSAAMYLAALARMQESAVRLGDHEAARKYADAYERGHRFMNAADSEGGLWNGKFYRQQWYDGRADDHLLQDQTAGILFGVVPDDRARSILDELNARSLTPYGIAETMPYYPAGFGYRPGEYHNGGVWPWVSFMDAWSRLRMRRRDEAVNLIRRVAKADLYDSGDYAANEHISSQTGENLGFQLQGWNADIFGLVLYGLHRPDVVP